MARVYGFWDGIAVGPRFELGHLAKPSFTCENAASPENEICFADILFL